MTDHATCWIASLYLLVVVLWLLQSTTKSFVEYFRASGNGEQDVDPPCYLSYLLLLAIEVVFTFTHLMIAGHPDTSCSILDQLANTFKILKPIVCMLNYRVSGCLRISRENGTWNRNWQQEAHSDRASVQNEQRQSPYNGLWPAITITATSPSLLSPCLVQTIGRAVRLNHLTRPSDEAMKAAALREFSRTLAPAGPAGPTHLQSRLVSFGTIQFTRKLSCKKLCHR